MDKKELDDRLRRFAMSLPPNIKVQLDWCVINLPEEKAVDAIAKLLQEYHESLQTKH